MFKTTQDLKEFILWAKDQRIEAVKVGDVEVKFSTLAFLVPDEMNLDQETAKPASTEERNTSKTLVDTLTNTDEEDEELLTWSSRP